MPEQNATLTIVSTTVEEPAVGTRGAGVEQVRKVVDSAVSVQDLQNNFASFLGSLRQILAVDSGSVGDLVLDEIKFSVEIGAKGDFKLLGTGVGASATSGLTFTLRRQNLSS